MSEKVYCKKCGEYMYSVNSNGTIGSIAIAQTGDLHKKCAEDKSTVCDCKCPECYPLLYKNERGVS